MIISLEGRTALVTGGSRGLGRATSLRLARSGASVVVMGRDPDAIAETLGAGTDIQNGKLIGIACDITDEASLTSAWRNIESTLGGIDILVNNAGQSNRAPLDRLNDDILISDYRLKVVAAVRLSQLAIPRMKQNRWGRIINTLAIAAKAPSAGGAPTALSRASGLSLTKLLSKELGPSNILVNGICVGSIQSEQWHRFHLAEAPHLSFEEFLVDAAERRAIPLGRVGLAAEFANLVCFLASDQASYISGSCINIDGGASPST